MALTDTGKNDILNSRFGAAAVPATYYVRAHTATPGLTGANGNEVAASGYAAASVANSAANFPASTANSVKNAVAIALGTNNSGASVTITHITLGKTNAAGTILHVIALTNAKVVAAGEVITIPINSLVVSMS